jgi:phage gp29-like protein
MNTRQYQSISRWRAQFNPLRGLTFQRAVSLLEEGERGAYADLQWTYRFIEKRDATLRALVQLRTAALKKLDWDIKLVDSDDPARVALAEKQAAVLRAAYEQIDNLKEAVEFLARAEFRGYAHLEKIYAGDNPAGGVVHLEPVYQWHWCRDTLYAPWQYNAEANSTNRGTPIDERHFVIREVEAPINELGLLCFLRKNLSQKDWDGFVETYGIPPLFAVMPPNTPPEKEAEYQAMAEAVVSDMRGTLPNGADIKTVGGSDRGTNPFRDHLTYQDEQLVLAGTSGKLTMLSSPTGIGGGATDAHQDTFDALAQAEAATISEIFQKQFDRAVLDAAGYAGQPALAYFQIAAEDKTDTGQILDHAVKAKQAGLQVDAPEFSEKTGYKLTVAPVAPQGSGFGVQGSGLGVQGSEFGTLNSKPQTLNRARAASAVTPPSDAFRSASLQRLGNGLAQDLQPARERLLSALDEADDAKRNAALTQLRADLPALLKGADGATATAFADILGTALVSGAAAGRQAVAPEKPTTRNAQSIFTRAFRTLFSR